MTEENAQSISMEEEKEEAPDAMEEEENPPTFTERGSPRLVIRQMVLEDFKSYGGERVIGPFHKSFSAVVGPNGSGKSNVIDALLFVFGKRATQLRLKRVSELIHHSGSVEERPAQAKVSVHFHEIIDTGDGDEDYEIVPNSEVVLSRVARRDNTSVYQWNGVGRPMSEISKYLQRKGVDLQHNRFLILQGEVEQISLMPPKAKDENSQGGLLEYLEDMIGSHQFVPATEEAAKNVEECTVKRQEALGRLQAVSREKEGLQAAQQEARSLLQAEQRLRAKQHLYAQLQKHSHVCQDEKLKADREKVASQLDETRETLNRAGEQMSEYKAQRKELKDEYDKIFEELERTKNEFQEYERRDIKFRADIQHAKKQVQKFTKQSQEAKSQYEKAEAEVQKAQEAIPTLEEARESLIEKQTEEAEVLDKLFQARQSETLALRQELDEVTTELAPLVEARSTAQAQLTTAQTALSLATSATEKLERQCESARAELAQLDANQQAQKKKLVKIKDELAKKTQQRDQIQDEDRVLAEKETQVGHKHKTLVARVEESKALLSSSGSNKPSKAVQGLLKASRPGGPLSKVGLLGRLGDLAAIHADYDVAISTACGMLDHLVVQTTAGAQRCLEFLRQHNLGRANFIPLDKLSKGAHDRPVVTPEDAPRLMDLLHYKQPALAPALFLAVGNTLVAPDLETATRWAYEYDRRWRVVTLDGKLIDTTGTMSGGGKSVKKGGMRLTNVKKVTAPEQHEEADQAANDLEQLQGELSKAEELLQQIRQRRKEIQVELRQLNKDLKAAQNSVPKLEMEISNCGTTRENLTRLIPQLEKQLEETEADDAKISELEDEVKACETALKECTDKASELEGRKAQLQKAILEAGGKEWKKQEAKCKKLQSDLDKTDKDIRAAKVSITTNEKNMAKAEKAAAKAAEQLADSKEALEKNTSDLKSLEEDAVAVMEAYEKVKKLEAEKKEELEASRKEFESVEKSQSSAKCAEIEQLGQLDALEKQLKENDAKSQHWVSEMEKIEKAAKQEEDEWGNLSEEDDEDDEEENEEEEQVSEEDKMSDGDEEGVKESSGDEDSTEVDGGTKEGARPKKTKNASPILPVYSREFLSRHDRSTVKEEIAILETERNTIAKNANLGAIAEYRKKEAEYLTRVAELDAITEERNQHRRTYEDLRRRRLEMFMDGFGQITLKLKEMYQMITLGGDAELELVDSLDPFSEGIVFSVRPPKKSWKNISNLSGGEKTLSSLALVFALHHYKPTPLYVMDEIDAALDFKNVSIVANYIKERTRNAQFVIISLRNNMFELADRLVGIYKTDNCTKSVTINPRAFGIEARQNGLLATTPALLNRTNKTISSEAKESARRRLTIQSNASSGSSIENAGE